MRVKLRKEQISNGRFSLYLDVYIDKDNQYQKRLKMYLEKEKSKADKDKNKETIRLAELIRNKLEAEILQKKFGQYDPRQDYSYSFIKYFDKLVAHRYETGVNWVTWRSCQKHLHNFTKKKMSFDEVTETWMEGYKAYLLSKVSQNSAHSYFNIMKRTVHTAFRDKLLENDPAMIVKTPRQVDTHRECLTEEELQRLKVEECRYPIMKKAFFFSVLTGLRWSDVNKLTWKNIVKEEGQHYIIFTQKKTREAERLPMNKEARKLIGERADDNERVFVGLKYSAWHNVALTQWMCKAEIKKHITFHSARHTNATLLLNNGVDIYTVSKMLGHKELKTTQIYAKLVNEKKIEAVEKLPSIL